MARSNSEKCNSGESGAVCFERKVVAGWAMRILTNLAGSLLLFFALFPAWADVVEAYERGGTLVFITEASLVATGGNVSAGSDASADCTVAAEIPVSNQWRKVFSIQREQTSNVRMLSRKSGQVLEIVSLDVFGYCGLRSDFLGAYRKVQVDRSAISSVRAILVAAHEAALDASKLRGAADAASLMRPFAGLADFSLAFDQKELASACSFTNDYGYFLQQSQQESASIPPLLSVVHACPGRTVAYLNLGDSYWAVGDAASASLFYQRYIDLLRETGRIKAAPRRVFVRTRMQSEAPAGR